MKRMITCAECPRCKDLYPVQRDSFGNHFKICGMSGNIVYTEPRREKRIYGSGYTYYEAGTCGLYNTVEDAMKHMTKAEIERWKSTQREKDGEQDDKG